MDGNFLDSGKFIFTYGFLYPIGFFLMKAILYKLLRPFWPFIINTLLYLETSMDYIRIASNLTILLSNLDLPTYVTSLFDAVLFYALPFMKTIKEFIIRLTLEILESSISNDGGRDMNQDRHPGMNQGTVERQGSDNNNSNASNGQNNEIAGRQIANNISDSDTDIQTGQNHETLRRQVTDMNSNSNASNRQNNEEAVGIPDSGINLQIRQNEETFRRQVPDARGPSTSDITPRAGENKNIVRRQVQDLGSTISTERISVITTAMQDNVRREATTIFPEECVRRLRSGLIYDMRPIYVSRTVETRNAASRDQSSYSLIRAPSCQGFTDWYGENLSRGQETFPPHTTRYERSAFELSEKIRGYTFT